MKQRGDYLVWMDLEMTGLDPKKCTVLEIGAIITDNNLETVAESPALAIHHADKILESMEKWSQQHHGRSGLTEECRRSRVSLRRAETQILNFIKDHCREKTAPLCGNTVWQDRRFLVRYMPRLESYLHYRMVDVSSIKELVGRWYGQGGLRPRQKRQSHRVRQDILESIEELRDYRRRVFRATPEKAEP